jgi:hypothetical protein
LQSQILAVASRREKPVFAFKASIPEGKSRAIRFEFFEVGAFQLCAPGYESAASSARRDATCHKFDRVATASQNFHNNPENKEFCRCRARPVAYLVLADRDRVVPRENGRQSGTPNATT